MNIPDFLTSTDRGDIRLAGHRIGLEDVVFYYQQGYSAEMLSETFPTLTLALIHKTIAFYLENQPAIEAYLTSQDAATKRLRATLPQGPSVAELRQRLASSWCPERC